MTRSTYTDFLKHSGALRSMSMSRSEALRVLGAAREGQKIDPITITAALWITGDVDGSESEEEWSEKD